MSKKTRKKSSKTPSQSRRNKTAGKAPQPRRPRPKPAAKTRTSGRKEAAEPARNRKTNPQRALRQSLAQGRIETVKVRAIGP